MSNINRLKEIKIKQLALLKQKEQYIKENKIYYINPNPLQAQVYRAYRELVYKIFTMTGANRIGKTFWNTVIGFSVMFGFWPFTGEKIIFPHNMPRKVRYVGQEWETHVKQVIIPKLEELWPKQRSLTVKSNQQGIPAIWIDDETGSSLSIMTNCQKTIAHEGWDGDLVLYDEPPLRDIRVANMRGLVDRCGREVFAMTLLGSGWVDREVIHLMTEKDIILPNGDKLIKGSPDPSVFSVNGEIDVNIGFGITQEGIDQFAKGLTEEEKEARLGGKPSYLAKIICPNFKRSVHLVDRFEIPTSWPIDIAIDVHPKVRQAVLFKAISPNGNKYVCDELWMHGDGTILADAIIKRIRRNAYRVNRIIIDPLAKADENNGESKDTNEGTTFKKIEKVLYRFGYELETASKDKSSGILEINNGLLGPNKIPSLFFFRDLARTILELEGWMYDDNGVPIKEDDHMVECLYRLLLLETEYWEEDEEEDIDDNKDRGVTGYGG